MKSLVLGGNGFIGSHLVDDLLSAGHDVVVLDKAHDIFRPPIDGVSYFIGDFGDSSKLAEALEGVDVVYHLISTTVPSTSNLDPASDVRGNLLCSLQLLDLMTKMQIKKIVYLSSGGTVYGVPNEMPIKETHALKPICSYGIVKLAVENYLYMYQQKHGLDFVILRASNPYGERQGHVGVQGVVGTFMSQIAKGEVIKIWGDGSTVRDYVYVGDLSRLCVQAGERSSVGIFNVGSGEGHSVKEVIDTIVAVSGIEVSPIYESARSFDVPRVVLDIENARRTYDFCPSVTLRDGFERTWLWLRSQIV